MAYSENLKKVVSDFDGVVTDSDAKAKEFHTLYLNLAAAYLGLSSDSFDNIALPLEAKMEKNPHEYGWLEQGVIVAPATEPFIHTRTLAHLVARQLGRHIDNSGWISFYQQAYQETGVVFKPEAAQYITDLQENTMFSFVTNAAADKVHQELSLLLGSDHTVKVVGGAAKHKLITMPPGMQRSIRIPGFPRSVYPERGKYHDIIQAIMPNVVIGDIYELDLLVPEQMGISTILLESNHTPPWEHNHYENHPYGRITNSLVNIVSIVLNRD